MFFFLLSVTKKPSYFFFYFLTFGKGLITSGNSGSGHRREWPIAFFLRRPEPPSHCVAAFLAHSRSVTLTHNNSCTHFSLIACLAFEKRKKNQASTVILPLFRPAVSRNSVGRIVCDSRARASSSREIETRVSSSSLPSFVAFGPSYPSLSNNREKERGPNYVAFFSLSGNVLSAHHTHTQS